MITMPNMTPPMSSQLVVGVAGAGVGVAVGVGAGTGAGTGVVTDGEVSVGAVVDAGGGVDTDTAGGGIITVNFAVSRLLSSSSISTS